MLTELLSVFQFYLLDQKYVYFVFSGHEIIKVKKKLSPFVGEGKWFPVSSKVLELGNQEYLSVCFGSRLPGALTLQPCCAFCFAFKGDIFLSKSLYSFFVFFHQVSKLSNYK